MSIFYRDTTTGNRYTIGRPFFYNDINYTKAGATHDTFISLGFQQVVVAQRPDDRFYIVSGPNFDGSYNSTERPLADLKTSFIDEYKRIANQLITPTDWYYARLTELGSPNGDVPAAVGTFRADVRTALSNRETDINATTTVAELETLINQPAQIYDEVEEEFEVNPDALDAWPELDESLRY